MKTEGWQIKKMIYTNDRQQGRCIATAYRQSVVRVLGNPM